MRCLCSATGSGRVGWDAPPRSSCGVITSGTGNSSDWRRRWFKWCGDRRTMHSNESSELTVSFIVPALNAESTLGACLDAILAVRSAGKPTEVLLIDNGSTDRTVEIARREGVKVISAPGLTVAALRNLGVRLA